MALRVVGLRVSPIYLDVVFILTDKIKSANFVYVVMSHNFTQGSVLGPLLFLTYVGLRRYLHLTHHEQRFPGSRRTLLLTWCAT